MESIDQLVPADSTRYSLDEKLCLELGSLSKAMFVSFFHSHEIHCTICTPSTPVFSD